MKYQLKVMTPSGVFFETMFEFEKPADATRVTGTWGRSLLHPEGAVFHCEQTDKTVFLPPSIAQTCFVLAFPVPDPQKVLSLVPGAA